MRRRHVVDGSHVDGQQGSICESAATTSLEWYVPAPPLSSFVTELWIHRSAPRNYAREIAVTTGIAQLVIDLSGDGLFVPDATHSGQERRLTHALLHGPYTHPFLVGTDRATWKQGANFAPGGAFRFFAPPAEELQNAHIPLEALWGTQAAQELSERLAGASTSAGRFQALEDVLLAHLLRPLEWVPAVRGALQAFSCELVSPREDAGQIARIADVAEGVGLSAGRLGCLFRQEIGLTPKQYVRIKRFQRAVRHTTTGKRLNWAGLAAECGYFDQAHLIKEFHALAGVCPCDYLRDRIEQMPMYLKLAT